MKKRKKETVPNPSWFKPGNVAVFTDEVRRKLSERQRGEKNHLWKGDKVGYFQLHKWVRNRKPVPARCEKCGKDKKLQLSNIGGKYTRALENWEYLCAKCHVYKDGTVYNLTSFSASRKLAA